VVPLAVKPAIVVEIRYHIHELGHDPMTENPDRFRSYLVPVLEELEKRLNIEPPGTHQGGLTREEHRRRGSPGFGSGIQS
jgi:hypothetical protein